jgi:hypothetical protein
MAINQRRKGKKGEQKAINFFKQWTGMDFKKSPASGGLRGHVVEYTVGDIICVEKNYVFPISVECKFYADINFAHLLYDVNSEIFKYWDQCLEDAERAEKFPLLMMRYNRLPADFFFIVMLYKDYRLLKDKGLRIRGRRFLVHNPEGGNLLITNTEELEKLNWKRVEKVLMKNLKKRWQKNR